MRGFLRFSLWVFGILGIVGLVLYLLVFDAWTVPGDDPMAAASVEPNLHVGDRLLILRGGDVRPGHLARCTDPDAPGRFVLGRVVAKAGETVAVDESVVVDGKRNPSPHACTEGRRPMRHPITQEDIELDCGFEDTNGNEHEVLRNVAHPEATIKSKVEIDKVYLVSDNRHIHLDSRDFGQIQASTCHHVVYRLWGDTWWDSKRRFTSLW